MIGDMKDELVRLSDQGALREMLRDWTEKELVYDDSTPPPPISLLARNTTHERLNFQDVHISPKLYPLPVMDWTERQNRRERARMRRHDRIEAALVLGLGAVLAVVLLALHVAPWVGR